MTCESCGTPTHTIEDHARATGLTVRDLRELKRDHGDLSSIMTVNDLLARLHAVPEWLRNMPVDIDLTLGQFPSGEEGAEDWIMSSAITGTEMVLEPRQIFYIKVEHS